MNEGPNEVNGISPYTCRYCSQLVSGHITLLIYPSREIKPMNKLKVFLGIRGSEIKEVRKKENSLERGNARKKAIERRK